MDQDKKYRDINLRTKSIDELNMIVTGVIGSTGAKDRHGETINPEGWDLKNYKKNPVILFGHDYNALPIGKAINVYVEDNKLKFDIQFASTQFGKEVFSLVKDGFLKAVSVGFKVIDWGDESKGEFTYMKQELLELSVVPVGANQDALLPTKSIFKLVDNKLVVKKKKLDELLKEYQELKEKDIEELKEEPKEEVIKDVLFTEDNKKILKALIKEVVDEAFKSYKIIEEKTIVKEIVVNEGVKNNTELLLQVRNILRKSDKETGLSLQKINKLLEITKLGSKVS